MTMFLNFSEAAIAQFDAICKTDDPQRAAELAVTAPYHTAVDSAISAHIINRVLREDGADVRLSAVASVAYEYDEYAANKDEPMVLATSIDYDLVVGDSRVTHTFRTEEREDIPNGVKRWGELRRDDSVRPDINSQQTALLNKFFRGHLHQPLEDEGITLPDISDNEFGDISNIQGIVRQSTEVGRYCLKIMRRIHEGMPDATGMWPSYLWNADTMELQNVPHEELELDDDNKITQYIDAKFSLFASIDMFAELIGTSQVLNRPWQIHEL